MFYKRQGDEHSITLSAPNGIGVVQTKEETGDDLAWLDTRWQIIRMLTLNLQSPWVRHTFGGRCFYRKLRSDSSVRREIPIEGWHKSKEEVGQDAEWFEQLWVWLETSMHTN